MRAAALIAVLACATAAHADGSRESRYGPAPERAPTPMDGRSPGYTGAPYSGRALGWAGKREIVAPEAQAASQVQPWWARSTPPAPQAAQAPQAQPAQPARTAYQPQVPAYAPPVRALPQSIYEAPPAASAAPAPVAYAAPAQPAQPQFQPGQIGARTYSVGRQFGMTPDAIPPAGPTRMALIAPPASAPEDDKPREDDDRDWPSQDKNGKDKKDGDQ